MAREPIFCSLKNMEANRLKEIGKNDFGKVQHGKLISDLRKKADLFDQHFMAQCTLVLNTRPLPAFDVKANSRLKSFEINGNDHFL